jgi:hypothetical protein
LQRKGIESEDEQVMDVLVIFTDNRLFLLQEVAPKTAQVSRAEKRLHNLAVSVSAKLWSLFYCLKDSVCEYF